MRLDERITVATPEGITLDIVLAGLGSRFLARLLDSLIQVVIIAGLAFGIFRYDMPGVVQAAGWVLLFLVMFAYDVPFEVLNNGRTPGKMFVDLVWAPNVDKGLAGYNVYRREAGGEITRIHTERTSSLSFQDTDVAAGHTYFYCLSAVDANGNESAKSAEVEAIVP